MNNTISKWLGECRHEWERIATSKDTLVAEFECDICHERKAIPNDGDFPTYSPDYENDPAAWTQELYGKIEEAGLWNAFAINLIPDYEMISKDMKDIHRLALCRAFIMQAVRATPAQKAAALSRSISEVENGKKL